MIRFVTETIDATEKESSVEVLSRGKKANIAQFLNAETLKFAELIVKKNVRKCDLQAIIDVIKTESFNVDNLVPSLYYLDHIIDHILPLELVCANVW
jgi:hypothetical protein